MKPTRRKIYNVADTEMSRQSTTQISSKSKPYVTDYMAMQEMSFYDVYNSGVGVNHYPVQLYKHMYTYSVCITSVFFDR